MPLKDASEVRNKQQTGPVLRLQCRRVHKMYIIVFHNNSTENRGLRWYQLCCRWWHHYHNPRNHQTRQNWHYVNPWFSASECTWLSSSMSRASLYLLSHYPTLGCDIQGLRAMGLSVQYWPRWFQDFPAIWLAVPFGANGAHLGICTLPEKIFFVCEISCFWVK